MPIQAPKLRDSLMPHGTLEEDQLDTLPMPMHHEMLELTVAARPFAIIRRASAVRSRQIGAASAPHTVRHHRSVARMSSGLDFAPTLAGCTALYDVCSG